MLLHADTFLNQSVQVGCLHTALTEHAEIAIAHVIGNDENDICSLRVVHFRALHFTATAGV
jgi:hypothetical protein